jgi:hypothetical protein
MRRFAFTLAATGLLFVFAAAGAVAHHHHSRNHGVRAHHARIKRFGDVTGQPATTTSSSDSAGTVTSFTNGVLTIQLNDGSSVSGTVTSDTKIECTTSGSQTSGEDQGDESSGSDEQGESSSSGTDEQGESNSSGTDESSSGDEQSGQSSSDHHGESHDQSSSSDSQGEDQSETTSSCSSSDLTPGKVVREAELRISSAGKTWEKVDLGS